MLQLRLCGRKGLCVGWSKGGGGREALDGCCMWLWHGGCLSNMCGVFFPLVHTLCSKVVCNRASMNTSSVVSLSSNSNSQTRPMQNKWTEGDRTKTRKNKPNTHEQHNTKEQRTTMFLFRTSKQETVKASERESLHSGGWKAWERMGRGGGEREGTQRPQRPNEMLLLS